MGEYFVFAQCLFACGGHADAEDVLVVFVLFVGAGSIVAAGGGDGSPWPVLDDADGGDLAVGVCGAEPLDAEYAQIPGGNVDFVDGQESLFAVVGGAGVVVDADGPAKGGDGEGDCACDACGENGDDKQDEQGQDDCSGDGKEFDDGVGFLLDAGQGIR